MSSLYILNISPLSDVGLVNVFSSLLFAVLSYLQCPLPYRNFEKNKLKKKKFCNFMRSHLLILILEHKLLVFCLGKFPLCLCVQGSSPVSFLLVSVCLVLCGDP